MTTAPVAATDPPRAARRRPLPSGGFGRFVLRRLAALVLLSLGITFVAFVLTELVPSNAAATNLGEQAAGDPAAVAAFKHHYGLDKPLPRPLRDLPQASRPRRPRPVVADARRGHARPRPVHPGDRRARALLDPLRGGRRDRVRRARRAAAEPARRPRAARRLARRHLDADVLDRADRALRRLLPARLVPRRRAARPGHEPAAERDRPLHDRRAARTATGASSCQAFHHLLLPALVLAAFNVSLLTRFTRSAVLEVIGNDYVRAARAKGLPERIVIVRYIVRAALPSVVTVLGLVFANVLTGAVLVEKIFSWPGDRPVRLPGGGQPRRAGDRGRQPVRGRRLHHRQLRRRHPLRRHRPADPGHVTRARGPRRGVRAARWLQRRACASRSPSSAR